MSINALIQKTLWTVKWTVLYSSVTVSGRTKTILEYSRKTTHSMSCTIELLCLKHTFDCINCFGGYITRGVICNCHIKRNGSLTFLAMLGSPPCLRRRSTMEEWSFSLAMKTGVTPSCEGQYTKLVIIYSMNRANGMS